MRPSPSVSALAAALAILVLPAALPAQTTTGPTPAATRPPGCRGTTNETSSTRVPRGDGTFIVFPGYPKIETVRPGSPAERAGMRPGDIVILQNGRDVVGNPPERPPLAGDTVVFTVRRGGVEMPITVVLGRWDPPEEAPGVTRVCRPLDN